ncbi:MAG: trypsin-like peptidase domain-containing protein [Planctomycetaceae bacterium]
MPPSASERPARFGRLCLLWACWLGSGGVRADDSPSPPFLRVDAIQRVVSQVEPSVVSIQRVRPAEHRAVLSAEPAFPSPLEGEGREVLPHDFGAGILVQGMQADELLVLTAYHVVRGGPEFRESQARVARPDLSELRLTFFNRRSCAGAIFAADPRSDLAVLAFNKQELGGSLDDLKPLSWKDSRPVKKGEIVVCLGNPYALARDGSASVSWGIVSNIARRPVLFSRDAIREQLLWQLGTVLQLDTRLQLGGSGGPVVNLDGQLVGIGTALAALEGYEKSAGFAIPVAPPMRRVLETLVAGQEVEYGLLGVAPRDVSAEVMRQNPQLFRRQPTAVEVAQISEQSPAAQQIRQGDILLSIDGQTLYASEDLMRAVVEKGPEEDVVVQLFRPLQKQPLRGEMLTVRSKLAKWPVREDDGIIASRPKYPPWRGLQVDYTSSREKFFKEQPFLPGVMVVDVVPNSPAERALLQPGDVITDVITSVGQSPVRSPAEFHRAVQALRGNAVLQLHVGRTGGRDSVTLTE